MQKSDSHAASSGATRQVLTFALGSETYGVDILRVKEIRGWAPVTRIPQSPPAVLGVLNLRGAIVPIIDLRLRFALPSAEFTAVTVIIVLSLRTEQGQRECGVVVDSVRDVVDLDIEDIRQAPSVQAGGSSDFIEGITTSDEQMLILLDADELVTRELSPMAMPGKAA